MKSNCIFSVDVEDWFHILDLESTPGISEWGYLESRVEKNFLRLLDIFSEKQASVTCFFLGWIAEKFPRLVKEALTRGHEIASHGYAHRLVYEMTEREFFEDALRSKNIIESITGKKVLGYRASGFSVTEKTPWFFDKLAQAGYEYDSSVFPAARGHGGQHGGVCAPYIGNMGEKRLMEFPITVVEFFKKRICFFGGGYLRIFPYAVIKKMVKKVLGESRPCIFYVHPREIDITQPRLSMGLKRRIKTYINIHTTESKIRNIMQDFEVTSFEKVMVSMKNKGEI